MKNLPKVAVIGAGGAMCAKISDEKWESGGLSPNELIECMPEIRRKFDVDVSTAFRTHSKNLQPEDWLTLANMIMIKLENADGVVIPHGKDTLHYSAAAISFMIQNLNKPVIFTGSQLGPSTPESDAKWNLYESMRVAGEADLAETVIVYAGKIMRGTRAKQIRTATYNAFDSIGMPILGKIRQKIILSEAHKKRSSKKPRLMDSIETNVCMLKMHPGFKPKIIRTLLNEGMNGLVIEGFGLGNIPSAKRSLIPAVERAIDANVPVVIASECQQTIGWQYILEKEVEENPYRAGAIPAYDMLSSTALVKLMWVLGQTSQMGKIRKMMLRNYVGEITPRSEINRFWKTEF